MRRFDISEKTTDNISVVPADDGKQFKINRKDLKTVFKACKNNTHRMVIDPTEVTDYWQGYICKDCGLGKLIRK